MTPSLREDERARGGGGDSDSRRLQDQVGINVFFGLNLTLCNGKKLEKMQKKMEERQRLAGRLENQQPSRHGRTDETPAIMQKRQKNEKKLNFYYNFTFNFNLVLK